MNDREKLIEDSIKVEEEIETIAAQRNKTKDMGVLPRKRKTV